MLKDRGAQVDVCVGAFGSSLFTALLWTLCVFVSNRVPNSSQYGVVVFLAMPILHGVASGLLSQWRGPQPWSTVATSMGASLLLVTIGVIVARIEGAVCLLMATPLIVPVAFFGAWIGWTLRQPPRAAQLALPTVAALSLVATGGPILSTPESRGEVTTVWHVAAPPERVWPYVLSIPSMSEPQWWLFRLGVAHPVRTQTFADGHRECGISTGPMPEIVTTREENRRLGFRVLSTPPSIREWNPFGEVHAAHLAETFRCKEGEFCLSPEGRGTRIVARSSYGLRMAPLWYWRLWSDAIVAHVHEQVVREIESRTRG